MKTFFDAFISYGRADSKAFATKLYNCLRDRGLNVWFDQNDIPLGVDFQHQIDDGIEKAHNFLFIIAPHSINSPYCGKEIELALRRNKRIIPLLHVEQIDRPIWQQRNPKGTDEQWEAYTAKGLSSSYVNMHSAIGKINWVYFREELDDFDKSLSGLIEVLQRHREYVEQHTYFLAKALEWERHRKPHSYLLIADDKQKAREWLNIRFKDEQSPCLPTDLHCEYITESLKNANNLMTEVFISSAEADREIQDKICNSLRRESLTVWTKETDVRSGESVESAIERGIQQADNVLYLLSPDSIHSESAQKELENALSLNKRIIPILVRETSREQIPVALQNWQYIDLTDNVKEEDYLLDESQLLRSLHEEEAYYNEHKILLTKALKWKQQNDNPSILLRGYNLRSAEAWLKVAQNRSRHRPTPLQEEFITASLRQPPAESLDVFISYSRTDSDLARKLNEELQLQGKTTWFDQESIASGTDFAQEIQQGIKASDNFLFIVSQKAVNSPYCASEVEYAASLNKRFVTVLHRPIDSANLHPVLAKVQWIDFNRNDRDFNENFKQLIRTLDTDREHLQQHTKWLQKAIEWQQIGKDTDLLLRGSELAIAQNWLQKATQHQKQPPATPLHQEFLEASQAATEAAVAAEKRQQAELLRLQEERTQEAEARLAEQKASAKRQKAFSIALSTLLVAGIGVSLVAVRQWKRAEISQAGQINAVSRFSLDLSATNRKLDAVLEAIRAANQLSTQRSVSPQTRSLALSALQAAAYQSGWGERNRLNGHLYSVNSVGFSPDGKTIATASGDKTVKLWNRQGQLLHPLEGHTQSVASVSFSPDSQMIASGSWDKTVKLWNREGQLLRTLAGHREQVYSVSFSPDGQTIATASQDKTVKLWNLQGQLLRTLPHPDGVSSVSFSRDGQSISTAIYKPPVVTLWTLQGKKLRTFKGHTKPIHTVAFSPDSQTIASGGDDNTIVLWNRTQDTPQLVLKGHNDSVKSVVFSPDGKTLASASRDETIIVWNRDNGVRQQTLRGHKLAVDSVSFSPDGKTLASASRDKTVKLWSNQGKKALVLDGYGGTISSVSFSPNGEMVATASYDTNMKLWNLNGKRQNILRHHTGVSSVSFSPDGQTIATTSKGGTISLWNLQGKLLKTILHTDGVYSVRFSPDGQTLAVGSEDSTVLIWSLEGQRLHTLKGHNQAVSSVAWSPDGKTIASGSDDSTVRLWNLDGEQHSLTGHKDKVDSVSFSPDGRKIASASQDGTVKLWNLEGKELHTLTGHTDSVTDVSFSPDGQKIASASPDGTIKLWNLQGELLQTLKGHLKEVYALAWSPDSKRLVSGSRDRSAIVWNLENLELEPLMEDACNWVQDYLTYNSQVEAGDRRLCKGIKNPN